MPTNVRRVPPAPVRIDWASLHANRASVEAQKWEGSDFMDLRISMKAMFAYIGLPPVKKQFYHEDPAVKSMGTDEVEIFRCVVFM